MADQNKTNMAKLLSEKKAEVEKEAKEAEKKTAPKSEAKMEEKVNSPLWGEQILFAEKTAAESAVVSIRREN